MSHLHPDQLAALALEPGLAEPDDLTHLEECARCRRELGILREVSARARQAPPDETPPAPPEAVWDRVVAELTSSGDLRPGSVGRTGEPVAQLPVWRRPWAAAAALILVVIVAAAALLQFNDNAGSVVAEATLEPLAQIDGASATLVVDGDARSLSVDQPVLPPIDGYYELWLLNEDGSQLVSLGPVTDARSYAIPAAIDTDLYSIVDISREPPDGDPAHSADSVLRGPLEPTA
ncbi:hypothetical protein BH23ACT10_BH23ACT10_16060 [soil metagenome]